MDGRHSAVAILPCTDLARSEAFYRRLGLEAQAAYEDYRILADGKGAVVHLVRVAPELVDRERNVHGLYLYSGAVEALAAAFGERAEAKPWGLIEFAMLDPDGTLVRVGWPG